MKSPAAILSIFRWPLHPVDDQDRYRGFRWFQFQAKLVAQSFDRRRTDGSRWHRRIGIRCRPTLRRKFEREIEPPRKACLIDHRAAETQGYSAGKRARQHIHGQVANAYDHKRGAGFRDRVERMAVGGKTGKAIAWRPTGFITWRSVGMGNKFRSRRASLCKLEFKDRTLPGIKMGCQLEAISKQGLHHETDLILSEIGRRRPCFDAVAIGIGPFRQMGKFPALQFVRPKLICEFDVHPERSVRSEEAVNRAVVIPGSERHI